MLFLRAFREVAQRRRRRRRLRLESRGGSGSRAERPLREPARQRHLGSVDADLRPRLDGVRFSAVRLRRLLPAGRLHSQERAELAPAVARPGSAPDQSDGIGRRPDDGVRIARPVLRDLARHLLVDADLQRQSRAELAHPARCDRLRAGRRRGVRYAGGQFARQIRLGMEHLVRRFGRVLEDLVDERETAAPIDLGDEPETRYVWKRELLAHDGGRLRELG